MLLIMLMAPWYAPRLWKWVGCSGRLSDWISFPDLKAAIVSVGGQHQNKQANKEEEMMNGLLSKTMNHIWWTTGSSLLVSPAAFRDAVMSGFEEYLYSSKLRLELQAVARLSTTW